MIGRRHLVAATGASALLASVARAQAPTIKLGVLTDLSGPYRDNAGAVSVACVRQAVQDFGIAGLNVEVISADHGNKPDLGVAIARRWIDVDGVDAVVDVPNSSVGLAVNAVVREKNKVYLNSGTASTDLTGPQCSPNTVQWTYDTYMLARSTGGAFVKSGGSSWFFVVADYVFGRQIVSASSDIIKALGGEVLGQVAYPFPATTDFSSYLLQAQASKAKVLGLANAGSDTINCVKQAVEFGLRGKMKFAALLMFISDVHGLGLAEAQGLLLTESFYWDLNDRTRAFSRRLAANMPGVRANMDQAGCYGVTLHFLKTVSALGGAAVKANGAAAVEHMKAMPTEDDAFGRGSIRADGRGMFPSYLFEVKGPDQSTGPWDYYKLVTTTEAAEAWRPLAQGGCPLIK